MRNYRELRSVEKCPGLSAVKIRLTGKDPKMKQLCGYLQFVGLIAGK